MKKLGTLLLAFALAAICIFLLPTEVQAASGTCGENLKWELDNAGTLTISGTGEMKNYDESKLPWYSSRDLIKSVVIEEGVTGIGESAFSKCSNLESVTIPESVTSIVYGMFSWCTSLTDITIPESVTSIETWAFYDCGLTDITIPDGVIDIGNHTFEKCSNLASVTIPDSVTYIGYSAFSSCTSLTQVVIPGSVTDLGDSAFARCTGLTDVTILDGVTNLAEHGLFYYCTNLANVTIPKSVTKIGRSAFELCSNLKNVFYAGASDDWGQITIGEWNTPLFDATVTFGECKHSYDGGVVTVEASCKDAGVKTYTCTLCGDSYTEEIEKLTTHSYEEGTCTVCGGSDPDYVPPTEFSLLAIWEAIVNFFKSILAYFGL
ncbi:MAG: leucine-rich repeat domain-containing protein [Ruminococcaceae bacterium]|nr:leucine-rich repeat domain-containing protein [Oscillospiraceae bacterium]